MYCALKQLSELTLEYFGSGTILAHTTLPNELLPFNVVEGSYCLAVTLSQRVQDILCVL